MGHFLFTREAGVWNGDTDVLAAELADLDRKTTAAVNGDDGGDWAPTSPIVLGGAGTQFVAGVGLGGAANPGSGVAIGGSVVVENGSATTFEGGSSLELASGMALSGSPSVPSSGLECVGTGAVKINNAGGLSIETGRELRVQSGGSLIAESGAPVTFGTLAVSGTTTLATTNVGILAATGTATFNGAADFNGAVALDGAVTLNGVLTPTGSGRVRIRAIVGANADTIYGVADADYIHLHSGTLTANRRYTLSDTSAANGDKILVHNESTGFVLTVDLGAETVELITATGQRPWTEFAYINNQWLPGRYAVK